ncbi:MAG: hypothetical protein FJ044_05450, partial [Candidatus Cloacimonetes bacterium]|nr:hypothetical protein [Candidatus Cloacimonadota bacterium]
VKRTLNDSVRGLGRYGVRLDNEAMELLSQAANGDARVALNALETAVSLVAQLPSVEPKPTLKVGNADVRRETSLRIENDIRDTDIKRKPTFKVDGKVKGIILTLEIIQEALQKSALRYDRAGEEHYNTISAFIKSLRGSDPDAALYYLARMLEAGEDPLFIARRMVILASEDIGNADPHALPLSVATFQACERIGLPECQINLAQCVTYLASSPKSNASYAALLRAQKDVQETLNEPIPLHIRNAPTFLMKNLGYGKNYKYAHNYEEGYTPQQYLPDKLKNHHYYHPTTYGEEGKIKQRLENLRKLTQSQKNSNSRCPKGLG